MAASASAALSTKFITGEHKMATRRDFLKHVGMLGATGAAAHVTRLGVMPAHAQAAPGYKALVCVFMFGGNDANNTVIPMTGPGFTAYQQTRGNLALAQGVIRPIMSGGVAYGLHPRLVNLQTLYNANKVA